MNFSSVCAPIVCFIGTRAELIKLAPVLREFQNRGVNVPIVASGQNDLNEPSLMKLAGSPDIALQLSKGNITQTAFHLVWWFLKTLVLGLPSFWRLVTKNHERPIVLVHGDTVSTVMGAFLGKLCGCRIAHLEAGLRSFNYLDPFPEEIDRVITSRLTDIHICPNEWAVQNLKHLSGTKVHTVHNTLLDSLSLAEQMSSGDPFQARLEGQSYGVFVIHRQENILNKERLVSFLELLRKASSNQKCIMLLHAPTAEALRRAGLLSQLHDIPNVIVTDRLPYVDFMQVLLRAAYLVTDGGSNQEEAYYIGLPCFILRARTERKEGLGENVVLGGDNFSALDAFLIDPSKYRRLRTKCDEHPSSIVVDTLTQL